MASSICVITARGGSKRIPRKNIKEFCGRPIIAYSIEAALESELFDEVMVSTDDEAIAAVAREFGASVPFMRSAAASDDYATTKDALSEVLENYGEMGLGFDSVCCLYPTAPFVTPRKLQNARRLFDEGVDTVLTIVKFSFPPQRALIAEDGGMRFWQPENAVARSQDLTPLYHDAGQFYFCKAERVMRPGTLLGPATLGYEVPETEVQDIDNPIDWELAEIKYERMVAQREQTCR